jgi:hypothetical protein
MYKLRIITFILITACIPSLGSFNLLNNNRDTYEKKKKKPKPSAIKVVLKSMVTAILSYAGIKTAWGMYNKKSFNESISIAADDFSSLVVSSFRKLGRFILNTRPEEEYKKTSESDKRNDKKSKKEDNKKTDAKKNKMADKLVEAVKRKITEKKGKEKETKGLKEEDEDLALLKQHKEEAYLAQEAAKEAMVRKIAKDKAKDKKKALYDFKIIADEVLKTKKGGWSKRNLIAYFYGAGDYKARKDNGGLDEKYKTENEIFRGVGNMNGADIEKIKELEESLGKMAFYLDEDEFKEQIDKLNIKAKTSGDKEIKAEGITAPKEIKKRLLQVAENAKEKYSVKNEIRDLDEIIDPKLASGSSDELKYIAEMRRQEELSKLASRGNKKAPNIHEQISQQYENIADISRKNELIKEFFEMKKLEAGIEKKVPIKERLYRKFIESPEEELKRRKAKFDPPKQTTENTSENAALSAINIAKERKEKLLKKI